MKCLHHEKEEEEENKRKQYYEPLCDFQKLRDNFINYIVKKSYLNNVLEKYMFVSHIKHMQRKLTDLLHLQLITCTM